jgi:hypothetical protein
MANDLAIQPLNFKEVRHGMSRPGIHQVVQLIARPLVLFPLKTETQLQIFPHPRSDEVRFLGEYVFRIELVVSYADKMTQRFIPDEFIVQTQHVYRFQVRIKGALPGGTDSPCSARITGTQEFSMRHPAVVLLPKPDLL